MRLGMHSLPAIGALALASACAAGLDATTVGGARPAATFDSPPMATDDAPIRLRWEQAISGRGSADVYLYAPGEPQDACHLAARAGGTDFHCENHAGQIAVTGIDPAAPHTVTIDLRRGSGTTALAVAQHDTPAALSRSSVPGTPDIAAGERLRARFEAPAGTLLRIRGFEVKEIN